MEVARVHPLFVRSEHLLRQYLAVAGVESRGVYIITIPGVSPVEAVSVSTDLFLLGGVLDFLKLNVVALFGC